MNILLLAPEPFYVERGTPIAVKYLAIALCRAGHKVDLLTYHEGEDLQIDGLRIFRTARLPFVRNIPIGFSWKKVVYDFLLTIKAMQSVYRYRYDVIHAVEESVFIGCLVRRSGKVKLVYDMDSSMADQLIEKWASLKVLRPIFETFEGFAIKRSDMILPVCRALADKVKRYSAEKKVCILEDIALEFPKDLRSVEDIRASLNLAGVVVLYVGNLEHYQGVDLALEAIATLGENYPLHFVAIGGTPQDVATYTTKADDLGIANRTHFLGPKPVTYLMEYLRQADILVSPRIKGQNTPMKIYSYLAAGKPILATNIYSHTQVLDSSCAWLSEPNVESFANGFANLLEDPCLRETLGRAAAEKARRDHTYKAFETKLRNVYASLQSTFES